MGNRAAVGGSGTGDLPRREVRTLVKLQHDVELANALRTWPSADVLASVEQAGAEFIPHLSFRMLVSNRVSKKMLPIIWKFNRNVLVEASVGGDIMAHFTPIQFYTFLKCLRDLHREASQLSPTKNGATDHRIKKDGDALRQESVDDNECALCMENKIDVVTKCAHAFCNKCLLNWISQNPEADATCPVCRGVLEREDSGTYTLAEDGTNSDIISLMAERLRQLMRKHAVNPGPRQPDLEKVDGTLKP